MYTALTWEGDPAKVKCLLPDTCARSELASRGHGPQHYDRLPIYVCDRVGVGSINLVVARRNGDGAVCYASYLIDLWKLGLKSSFGSFSMKTKRFDEIYKAMIEGYSSSDESSYFSLVDIDEAKWLVAQGIRIAEAVGTPFSKRYVPIVGGISQVKIGGSLYKCFNCEKGELPPEVDGEILSIARAEGRSGMAGTPQESTIYFECEKCRSKQLTDL
jgi:hypothetical protein